jgi:23S rRNA (cytosine1962-C5)-methyltransferase
MADKPIRWMIDDAAKFTAREVAAAGAMTGSSSIPPQIRPRPHGEVWRLEEHCPALSPTARSSSTPTAASCPHRLRRAHVGLAIGELLARPRPLGGRVECGDMAVREEARRLLLPTAIFARWSR